MAPTAQKRATRASRQPLATTTTPCDQTQLLPTLIEIFNNSQHVTTSDQALNQIKKLYKNAEYTHFEVPFRNLFKKLLQSKQSIYFKTSCDFVCKFLQHVLKLSDEIKAKERETMENTAPGNRSRKNARASVASDCPSMIAAPTTKRARQGTGKRGPKRKSADVSDDELVMDFMSTTATTIASETHNDSTTDDDSIIMESSTKRRRTIASMQTNLSVTITSHDRLVSSCIDVADHYMQVPNEECRFNAVFFVCKFLAHVESLDEEICNALKSTLAKRIRDRKPSIRAQAVLASRKFQDNKMTQEGFLHHFYRDPELIVRKALLQIMDTEVFGYDFLIDSTQDSHENMRKAAFQRLGKISPSQLNSKQFHRIMHNGLIERERQASYSFKTHTLDPWLTMLYDGLDLIKLLDSFDVINYREDVERLLELIYERNLDKLENNGTATKLHHVVEAFRERWLSLSNNCLPAVSQINEKIAIVWLTLVKFCKTNHRVIKPVKIRTVQAQTNDPDESIEKILDSQENNDEVVELYERLTPDLVNLIDFLKRFVNHAHEAIQKKATNAESLEFVYHQLMEFISSYEIGDELERKTVQEVLGHILKENLLTGEFSNFIPPLIRCLFTLIYSNSSNLMINYISELINNVRSDLEDLAAPTQQQTFTNREIFKNHTNELVQCLQMYFGCLQSVKVKEVPQTMRNHLHLLTFESLDEWFKDDIRVRSLLIACTSLTALLDKEFAKLESTVLLLVSACFDSSSLVIKASGFKGIVDAICQHDNLDVPVPRLEKFLNSSLRDYGKYNPSEVKKDELEFITAVIEGVTKLYYHQKLASAEILSHLILWWYHPRTPSKLKQFIGVFLPTFVGDLSRRRRPEDDSWLEDLLEETFVTSIEYLHDYILGPGFNIMCASDMQSLISFLCNLIPISFHAKVSDAVDRRMDDLSSSSPDLLKYLKQSKNGLSSNPASDGQQQQQQQQQEPLARPLQLFD